jgi:hypothetical protein
MGANTTQAQAALLFLVGFVFIAAGLAQDVSYVLLIMGLALNGASIALFLKCKPWENAE